MKNENSLKGYNEIVAKLASPQTHAMHILHAAMGLASEAGEILDNVKAHLFYDKPLDEVNLVEEAGDILWFLSLLLQQQGLTIEDAVAGNRAKLAKRYGEDFDPTKALNRDKPAELKALAQAIWGN